jgi:hypothetical protein
MATAAPVEVEAQAERPVLRPPVARLCILDDTRAEGEWVRLRSDQTVIGRTEGEIRIPHDGLISSRHAQIVRQRLPNGWRWTLVDLHSTNGTFVRVGSTMLRHEFEILIGGGRYRFEGGAAPAAAGPGAPQGTTQAWSEAPLHSLVPSLVEMSSAGPLGRFPLTLPEYWIGRDAQACAISRPEDVLVNARHARLYRDAKGHWHIENHKSLNGVWLRITEPIPIGPACRFRLGEQRFHFRVT